MSTIAKKYHINTTRSMSLKKKLESDKHIKLTTSLLNRQYPPQHNSYDEFSKLSHQHHIPLYDILDTIIHSLPMTCKNENFAIHPLLKSDNFNTIVKDFCRKSNSEPLSEYKLASIGRNSCFWKHLKSESLTCWANSVTKFVCKHKNLDVRVCFTTENSGREEKKNDGANSKELNLIRKYQMSLNAPQQTHEFILNTLFFGAGDQDSNGYERKKFKTWKYALLVNETAREYSLFGGVSEHKDNYLRLHPEEVLISGCLNSKGSHFKQCFGVNNVQIVMQFANIYGAHNFCRFNLIIPFVNVVYRLRILGPHHLEKCLNLLFQTKKIE